MIVFSIFATLSNMNTESFDLSKYENNHRNSKQDQWNSLEQTYWDAMNEQIKNIHNQEQKDEERKKPDEMLYSLDKSDPTQTYDIAKQIPIWGENIDSKVSYAATASKKDFEAKIEKDIITWPWRLQWIYKMFS